MSTAIPIGASTLQLPDPGENYSLSLINNNSTAIATEINAIFAKYPKGLIAEKVDNTSNAGYSGTFAVGSIASVNLVAGRWYRARYIFTVVSASANEVVQFDFVKSIVSDVTATGTSVGDGTQRYLPTNPTANNSSTVTAEARWKATTTETVNIKSILARAIGASTFDINSRTLSIEDLGAQF